VAAVDFVEIALEESPNTEATYSSSATPNRKSTNLHYPRARAVRLSPAPTPLSRADELTGLLGEPARLADDYAPAGSLSTRAYGDLMTWLLAINGWAGVHTAGDGIITDPDGATIPAGAHKWVFTKQTGITPQTARIRTNYSRENVELDGYGYALASLNLNAAGEITGDLVGLFIKRLAADATTVPAVIASTKWPFRRGDLVVTGLGGGSPALSDFTIAIANSLERDKSFTLATPSLWPDQLLFGEEQVQVSGTIPKRLLSSTDYDAMVAGTTFALTAKWISPAVIGATAKKYGMWFEMPAAQYVGGDPAELTNSRRRGLDLNWFAAIDDVAGYDCKITLVNGISAVATYT